MQRNIDFDVRITTFLFLPPSKRRDISIKKNERTNRMAKKTSRTNVALNEIYIITFLSLSLSFLNCVIKFIKISLPSSGRTRKEEK